MKASDWKNLHVPHRTGIAFHNRFFTEPALFHMVLPPIASGIYAILVPDSSSSPRPFRAIYFGESRNLNDRVTGEHERYGDWVTEAGNLSNLYVAFCLTPPLRGEQRRWVENDLIARYRPACNLKGSHPQVLYQPMLGMAK